MQEMTLDAMQINVAYHIKYADDWGDQLLAHDVI